MQSLLSNAALLFGACGVAKLLTTKHKTSRKHCHKRRNSNSSKEGDECCEKLKHVSEKLVIFLAPLNRILSQIVNDLTILANLAFNANAASTGTNNTSTGLLAQITADLQSQNSQLGQYFSRFPCSKNPGAGAQITAALNQTIALGPALFAAVGSGDPVAIAAAVNNLNVAYQNVAAQFASVNPDLFSLSTLQNLFAQINATQVASLEAIALNGSAPTVAANAANVVSTGNAVIAAYNNLNTYLSSVIARCLVKRNCECKRKRSRSRSRKRCHSRSRTRSNSCSSSSSSRSRSRKRSNSFSSSSGSTSSSSSSRSTKRSHSRSRKRSHSRSRKRSNSCSSSSNSTSSSNSSKSSSSSSSC